MRFNLSCSSLLIVCAAACFADDDKKWPEPGAPTPGPLTYLFKVTGVSDYVDPWGGFLTGVKAGDIQSGTIKKLDGDGAKITITVAGKDFDYEVPADRLKAKLKDFKEGTDVGFMAVKRDGKDVLTNIGLPTG